jgi:hypothetical protein
MKHPEDILHKQIAQYLSILLNQKRIDFFTYNASGELRTKITGALLKKKGLQRGIPDFTIDKSVNNIKFLLYLEAKVGKNKQTKEQKEYEERAEKNNNEMYRVVRTIEEVEKYIKVFLTKLIPIFFEDMQRKYKIERERKLEELVMENRRKERIKAEEEIEKRRKERMKIEEERIKTKEEEKRVEVG